MIKILLINYEYPPLGGGTAIANQYLAKEFARIKNLKMDILTSSPGIFSQQYLYDNIRIIRLNIGKNSQNFHHQSYTDLFRFFLISTAWTLNHRKDYDLIHAFSGLPGSITAWISRLPYLVSFRGADEPGYEPRHDFLLKIIKPLLKIIYSRAKFLDANSQYLKSLLLKSFPNLSIQVINNGVDTTKFFPGEKMISQSVILCTSRLAQRKGVEFLIKAMPLVLAKIPQAKLQLVGEGVLSSALKQLVKKLHLINSVKFLGLVEHDQLPTTYRQAKLFVLPSLSESQSNSLLEALASGLPVVATNVGGNPELINSQNEILVPPADSQKLAKAIIKALNKKWPKIHLSSESSWQKAASHYVKIYRQNL